MVPSGETDWIWLSKLERGGQAGLLSLLTFYHELAEMGRIAKDVSGSESASVEPLLAQEAKVQQAYDQYIKSLIDLEITWKAYLQRVNLLIGVHVIGLKQKIDRGLPTRVDGFHSSLDGQLKVELRTSTEALRVAQGRVERGYTTLVWVDRAVIAAQFALPLVAGAKVAFQEAAKRGLSQMAALKVAIVYVLPRAAASAATGVAVGEILPRVLQGMGVDEADARAGITIFLSLIALRNAAMGTATKRGQGQPPAQRQTETPSFRLPVSMRKFWVKSVIFKGVKVYQRDDLIDPGRLDPKGRTTLQRMKRGLAAIGPDGKPMQLHHMLQTRDGPLAEVTGSFHLDNRAIVHINPPSIPSGINRSEADSFRAEYWERRAANFEDH